ncbi:MAG: FAD-dependent oxidoreductase [Candidatus Margulisbacteria bacterium]|nr:FAD-dependent oxidoreductase [Candidatus Margulisiibacteriota bacterium]
MLLDLIIVGGGPAGITASVYAARKKISFAILAKEIGGQAAWSGNIENYLGFQLISGPDLVKKFSDHLNQYKFDLREGSEAIRVEKDGGNFKTILSNGEQLLSRTVLIASGKRPKKLDVPGEKEYLGRGVAYCATCDGPLFAGKAVAIVGGGNSALDAAIQMEKIAEKVYLVNIAPDLTGDQVVIDKVKGSNKVEIINNSKAEEIMGDQFVKAIKVAGPGQTKGLKVEGVFIEIGLIPNSGLIDCVKKNDHGEIMINSAAETSCPGVFAAGDVTDVPAKQIIIAAGDGAKAALSAFSYLNHLTS